MQKKCRFETLLPTSVLLYIYNSFIHLYLSFALWCGAKLQNTNLDKILLLQKRAPRLIYFSNNSGHAIPLFLRSNILPIDMLYYKSGVLMHDIDHDLPPQNLKNLFTRLNLLRNRLSGCHTTLLLPFGGVLRDIPKDGCEGDHTRSTSFPGPFILGRKDPGSGWSRASQKVGGDTKTAGGRSEQVAILSFLNSLWKGKICLKM